MNDPSVNQSALKSDDVDSPEAIPSLQEKFEHLSDYVSLLIERIEDIKTYQQEDILSLAESLDRQQIERDGELVWRWIGGQTDVPVETLVIKGAKAPPKVQPDGPVQGYGWCCGGVVRQGMQPAPWKLANFLFNRKYQAATEDDIRTELDKVGDGDKKRWHGVYKGRADKFNEFCRTHGFTHSITIESGEWTPAYTAETIDGRCIPICKKDKYTSPKISLRMHKPPRKRRGKSA